MTPRNEMVLVQDRVVRVALTQGQVALIDLEDIELIGSYRWHAWWSGRGFYAKTNVLLGPGRWSTLLMHRVVLGLESGDPRQGDHVHHQTLDNRRSQLRVVTHRQNSNNRKTLRRGYSWEPSRRRWAAYEHVEGKKRHLGRFVSEREAAEAVGAFRASLGRP